MIQSFIALALFAQTVWPQPQRWAYTTADPIDPARLGLATVEGRYSIVLGNGCEGISDGLNVAFHATPDYSVQWLVLPGSASDGCRIEVIARMSEVPCFTVDDMCDIGAEVDE